MILNPKRQWTLLVVVISYLLGTGGLLAQSTTPSAPPGESRAGAPHSRIPRAAHAAAAGCQRKVGILGNYFESPIQAFLVANGQTVTPVTAADIALGALNSLEVLYVLRDGSADATTEAILIERWVHQGGVLITEFDATELLFDGTTFGFFSAASLYTTFGVPSFIGGGNVVAITDPTHPLASGVSSVWCSGDPIGVFKVYDESTLDPALDRVARVGADLNGDGSKDVVVGAACIDYGAVVAFFTDFADFNPLQNPFVCPPTSGYRTIEEETLLLNAVCRAKINC